MTRFALVVLSAVFALSAAAQQPSPRYDSCMDLARKDPGEGIKEAIAWRKQGGGAMADHCLATGLIARGDHAEGAQLLQEIASEDWPAHTRAMLYDQAGRAWLSAGEDRKAWGALTDGLAADPDSSDLLVDRGIANAALGLNFEAIDDLDRALDLAPGRADALVLRASAWRRAGNLDLASDDVARALAQQPQNVDALLERGNIHRARGNTAAARTDWIAVLQLDPNGPSAEIARDNLEKVDVREKR
jgi:tetratricopeptide (TPR) repeat protein